MQVHGQDEARLEDAPQAGDAATDPLGTAPTRVNMEERTIKITSKLPRIGERFQASVSSNPSAASAGEAIEARLLWNPAITTEDVLSFLDTAAASSCDESTALTVLLNCRGNRALASQQIQNVAVKGNEWSADDARKFKELMCTHGKCFDVIQSHLSTHSLKHIIEFYYSWKNTPEYKEYKTAGRIPKAAFTGRLDFPDFHNDVCEVCGKEGELICCDTCSLAYHKGCLDSEEWSTDKHWSCTACKKIIKTPRDRQKALQFVKTEVDRVALIRSRMKHLQHSPLSSQLLPHRASSPSPDKSTCLLAPLGWSDTEIKALLDGMRLYVHLQRNLWVVLVADPLFGEILYKRTASACKERWILLTSGQDVPAGIDGQVIKDLETQLEVDCSDHVTLEMKTWCAQLLQGHWTTDEDEALEMGTRKHGSNSWSEILLDQELRPRLWRKNRNALRDRVLYHEKHPQLSVNSNVPQCGTEYNKENLTDIFSVPEHNMLRRVLYHGVPTLKLVDAVRLTLQAGTDSSVAHTDDEDSLLPAGNLEQIWRDLVMTCKVFMNLYAVLLRGNASPSPDVPCALPRISEFGGVEEWYETNRAALLALLSKQVERQSGLEPLLAEDACQFEEIEELDAEPDILPEPVSSNPIILPEPVVNEESEADSQSQEPNSQDTPLLQTWPLTGIPWSVDETRQVVALMHKNGYDWDKMQKDPAFMNELGSNRGVKSVKLRWNFIQKKKWVGQYGRYLGPYEFTDFEKKMNAAAAKRSRDADSGMLEQKTQLNSELDVTSSSINNLPWSVDETRLLVDCMRKYGQDNWTEVTRDEEFQQRLGSIRNLRSIKMRWHYVRRENWVGVDGSYVGPDVYPRYEKKMEAFTSASSVNRKRGRETTLRIAQNADEVKPREYNCVQVSSLPLHALIKDALAASPDALLDPSVPHLTLPVIPPPPEPAPTPSPLLSLEQLQARTATLLWGDDVSQNLQNLLLRSEHKQLPTRPDTALPPFPLPASLSFPRASAGAAPITFSGTPAYSFNSATAGTGSASNVSQALGLLTTSKCAGSVGARTGQGFKYPFSMASLSSPAPQPNRITESHAAASADNHNASADPNPNPNANANPSFKRPKTDDE